MIRLRTRAGALFAVTLVIFVVGLTAFLILEPFERGVPKGAPSEATLARAAVARGLTNDVKASHCVANLIRHSRLSVRTMKQIAENPTDWIVSEGPEYDYFTLDVDEKMSGQCGAEAWPGVDSWPSDPDRS